MKNDEFDLIVEALIKVCLVRQQHGAAFPSAERVREIADRLEASAAQLAEWSDGQSTVLAVGFADLLRRTYGTDGQTPNAGSA